MGTFGQILTVIAAIFLVCYMYSSIKRNPEAFSKEALNKSVVTMSFLGLALIAFIAFCVFLLRAG